MNKLGRGREREKERDGPWAQVKWLLIGRRGMVIASPPSGQEEKDENSVKNGIVPTWIKSIDWTSVCLST